MNTTAAYPCVRHFNPENLQVAFRTKEDSELKLAHWLFRLMGTSTLTRLEGAAIGEWFKLGLFSKVLFTNPVYRQFCGCQTVQEAQQAIEMLKAARKQTALAHAAKCRATEEGFAIVQEEVLRNIALAAQAHSFSLISIKLTNLGRKEIFQKLTEAAPLTPEEQSAFVRTCSSTSCGSTSTTGKTKRRSN